MTISGSDRVAASGSGDVGISYDDYRWRKRPGAGLALQCALFFPIVEDK
jgi:hypothetical protein